MNNHHHRIVRRQQMNFHRPMVMNIHYRIIHNRHRRRNKRLKRKSNIFFLISYQLFVCRHTKELLDEALDSVKNVLMQTFKKNLESGGDLK